MRIETVRFGVKTNKTIRKGGTQQIKKMETEILKHCEKQARIELIGGKLLKSSKNYEKIDKNERKRKLKQDDTSSEEESEEQEEYLVQVIHDHEELKRPLDDDSEKEEDVTQDLTESED